MRSIIIFVIGRSNFSKNPTPMNKIKSFFWYCSGADSQLLDKCPTDSSKYVGIGATIFFTGLFAALASGYALYTVFEHLWISIASGLLWGLMVFNLDRFIVSSMRKRGNGWNQVFMATPRILLAILISVVIAKPLELKVFEKEVNSELQVMQLEQKTRLEAEIESRYAPTIRQLNVEIESLKSEIELLSKKRDTLYEIARVEADGTGGTMKRNAGPIYQIKKKDADQAQFELEALRKVNESKINDKYIRLLALDSAMNQEITATEQAKLGGLASRLEALDRLTNTSEAIWLANIFILLLFIAVETAPIFVKIISHKGPYDQLLETAEYKYEIDVIGDKAYIHDQLKRKSQKLAAREKEFVKESLDMKLNL